MSSLVNTRTKLWKYLSSTQQDLIMQGDYLITNIIKEGKHDFKDYSFVVFPFAKAYEGYLKQLFLDVSFINHLDYISDHFRLGKFLSPHLIHHLGERSLYHQIYTSADTELAEEIWQTWKMGRNQIFHYYPHNIKAVTFEDAENIINRILQTMKDAYARLYEHKKSQS